MYCISSSYFNAITLFFSFNISVLLCWFALLFKFTLPSDQLILLPWFLFHLSPVHSGSKNIIFSCLLSFFLIYVFSALTCAVVACVTSRFYIVKFSSLLRKPLAKSSSSWEAVNLKTFFCADSHCYSGFILPMINWFHSFERINA